MIHRLLCRMLLAGYVLTFAGCAAKRPVATPTLAKNNDFMDLHAGLRLRVVVPLLKHGGYILKSLQQQSPDGALDLDTKGELIGYQQSLYEVRAGENGGISVQFLRTERWENGKLVRKTEERLGIVDGAMNSRRVRVVYLLRGDRMSHDMALVFANDPSRLDLLTQKVVADGTCERQEEDGCLYVPLGIGVAVEEKVHSKWVPAR